MSFEAQGIHLFRGISRDFCRDILGVPGLVTRIAATSNRKSLATVIATQKITATPKTPLKLRFHCDFCEDFRGSAKRKTLAFFGVPLLFFQKSKGRRVRGSPGTFQKLAGATPPPPRDSPNCLQFQRKKKKGMRHNSANIKSLTTATSDKPGHNPTLLALS